MRWTWPGSDSSPALQCSPAAADSAAEAPQPVSIQYTLVRWLHLGDAIAKWLVCSTSVREIRVRVSLAAGGRVATVGQLLFAPWAWAYSTLHP